MLPEKLRAAFVVARRDFVAVIFSKTFIFFLLGPLFPLVIGAMAGSIGAQVQRDLDNPSIGVAMPAHQGDRLVRARNAMADRMAGQVPDFVVLDRLRDGETFDARAELAKGSGVAAVVTGTLDAPVLTGPQGRIGDWQGMISTFAARARTASPTAFPEVRGDVVQTTVASQRNGRIATAQGGQVLLFLLTMLLAGMVLSNLVEEKGNKIIEVLAAAIPMDALFLGKLFAMLAVSLVGIAVWGTAYGALVMAGMRSMPELATPAVGWPVFLVLGFFYFAMAYLLLGSLFLSIGGMATTVREVQTLSMPVTMMQLMVFFFASFALARPGTWIEWAAILFPVSSPFAMIAQAAQKPALWPHLLALGWQAAWVLLIVRMGAQLFRRTVLKSGAGGRPARRSIFAMLRKPA
ncbi:ABC transporter permease [Novosphingobium olei]|uniref:ABC transporter permease n=1 Tax=Novosphingobium olei TaxID=2728851 RepID=UPI003087D43A|nr:ABC transporter permease [Novosphingobium olei]